MINWKTTLLGIIAGTLVILQNAVASYQSGTPVQWLQIVLGITLMALGLVMKDFNVTGIGTTATTDVVKAADMTAAIVARENNVVAGPERQRAIAAATEAVKASLVYPTPDNPEAKSSKEQFWNKPIDEAFPPMNADGTKKEKS